MIKTTLPKPVSRYLAYPLAIASIGLYLSLSAFAFFSYCRFLDPRDLTIAILALSLLFVAAASLCLIRVLRKKRLAADLTALNGLTRELLLEKEALEPYAPLFHRIESRYSSILALNPTYPFYEDYLADLARSMPDSLLLSGSLNKKEAELELHFLRLLDRLDQLAAIRLRSPSLIRGKEQTYWSGPASLYSLSRPFIRGFHRFDVKAKFPHLYAFEEKELALP